MSLHLFEGFGVELEYMIVDRESLSVKPMSDEILKSIAGRYVSEVDFNGISWSNELVLHVIELKTRDPVAALDGLAEEFGRHVAHINDLLEPLGGRLMPSAMHPWMDPDRETRLWPHEYSAVYDAYNRIFDCRGHGWSNLQSVHLNLPFCGDEEFGRLHAAVRLLLPILPALAAASPVMDGRVTGISDNRLHVYQQNQRRIPSITGRLIPEAVFTRRTYETQILEKIYRDIAPLDPEGVLQFEWLNSRGAIARFDRNTIEIRVLDSQECPAAELAVYRAVVAVLRALVEERWTGWEQQKQWDVDPLAVIYEACVRDAEQAVIENPRFLQSFGLPSMPRCSAGEMWRVLLEELVFEGQGGVDWAEPLRVFLEQGTLARRILSAVGNKPSRQHLQAIYRRLADCLAENRVFRSTTENTESGGKSWPCN